MSESSLPHTPSPRPILKIDSLSTMSDLREQLKKKGLDAEPSTPLRVSFKIKTGVRRRIKSGKLTFIRQCAQGCCPACYFAEYRGQVHWIQA